MIKLEPLTGRHERNEFECGVDALNRWLKQTALQHQGKGVSRTFVAVPSSAQLVDAYRQEGFDNVNLATILGFYAMSSALVLVEELPPELGKRYPGQIPVTRLGRLAIRADMQGQGLGGLLLANAIDRARGAAQAVGSAGIFVDAKDDDAARFYSRFGFRRCGNQLLKLYLPMW